MMNKFEAEKTMETFGSSPVGGQKGRTPGDKRKRRNGSKLKMTEEIFREDLNSREIPGDVYVDAAIPIRCNANNQTSSGDKSNQTDQKACEKKVSKFRSDTSPLNLNWDEGESLSEKEIKDNSLKVTTFGEDVSTSGTNEKLINNQAPEEIYCRKVKESGSLIMGGNSNSSDLREIGVNQPKVNSKSDKKYKSEKEKLIKNLVELEDDEKKVSVCNHVETCSDVVIGHIYQDCVPPNKKEVALFDLRPEDVIVMEMQDENNKTVEPCDIVFVLSEADETEDKEMKVCDNKTAGTVRNFVSAYLAASEEVVNSGEGEQDNPICTVFDCGKDIDCKPTQFNSELSQQFNSETVLKNDSGTSLEENLGTKSGIVLETVLRTALGSAMETSLKTSLETSPGTALKTDTDTNSETASGTAMVTALGTDLETDPETDCEKEPQCMLVKDDGLRACQAAAVDQDNGARNHLAVYEWTDSGEEDGYKVQIQDSGCVVDNPCLVSQHLTPSSKELLQRMNYLEDENRLLKAGNQTLLTWNRDLRLRANKAESRLRMLKTGRLHHPQRRRREDGSMSDDISLCSIL